MYEWIELKKGDREREKRRQTEIRPFSMELIFKCAYTLFERNHLFVVVVVVGVMNSSAYSHSHH